MGQGLSRSSSSLPLQLINHTPECTALNERHTLVTLESVMAYDDDLPLFSITFISESRILPNVFPTYDHEEALYWVRDMIAVGPRANRPGGAERLRIKLRVRAKAGCKWCATTIVEGTDPEGYRQITEQAYQRDPNVRPPIIACVADSQACRRHAGRRFACCGGRQVDLGAVLPHEQVDGGRLLYGADRVYVEGEQQLCRGAAIPDRNAHLSSRDGRCWNTGRTATHSGCC